MGRRSDHSREELEALILATGAALMAEVGLARFSAREVAKRIGYSIGTIHNVFGSYDRLVMAINTQTFGLWAEHLRLHFEQASDDRIAVLVEGYFSFARANVHRWSAIYGHHLPDEMALPEADRAARGVLTEIVVQEVARALGRVPDEAVAALSRSLIATVHGHCAFAISGAWALMGEAAPEVAALKRVREALAGQG
ncbi:TetR/AcrR family transcriptional regulator [Sphingomonas sp. SUN019]|uniref:TetR/AcrR family transcriptional regulator n=1 Tax=Sphingomonas sp. SUN019 TaxID=2937788 RepID=UPI0021642C4C|nr:TetR/AcrR family transcriptional regulator [Sphingomonas sp. SUN019]UVO51150.1 TetR/AcrR family transcriptional regulator [Sphingomonas sp. SUN019]